MSLDQFLILSFSLLFSAFLNYLLALYSEVDFFKLDFSKTKNEKKKVNKLKIILRNIYLTFILNSFFQLFLSMVISEIVGKKLSF